MSTNKALYWDITSKCNLRCKHCYNSDKYFSNNRNDLSLVDKKKTLDIFKEKGFSYVHFLGGEPLCSPDILDVIKYASDTNWFVSLNTNGTLLDKKMITMLNESGLKQIGISIDGATEKVNDSIRGDGVYKKIINALDGIYAQKNNLNYQVQLVYTLTDSNLDDFPNILSLLKTYHIDLLVINLLFKCGNALVNWDSLEANESNIYNSLDKFFIEYKSSKIATPVQIDSRVKFAMHFRYRYNVSVIYNENFTRCKAGDNIIYIEADGRVHPCDLYDSPIGKSIFKDINKIEYAFDNKYESSKYWNSFKERKRNGLSGRPQICVDCSYSNVCVPCPLEYTADSVIPECKLIESINLYNYHTKYKDRVFSELINMNFETHDEVTNRIISLIGTRTVSESIEILLQEFDVEKNILIEDVTNLLYQIENRFCTNIIGENQ